MIIILAALLGAVLGALNAKRRGGSGLDMAQYAGTYALVFGIVALFVTVIIARMSL